MANSRAERSHLPAGVNWSVVLVAIALVLGGAGYVLGRIAAPDEKDAKAALAESRRAASLSAERTAYAEAKAHGVTVGTAAGRKAAQLRGSRLGREKGRAEAERRYAAAVEAERQRAAAAEKAERARNCGAPLFAEDYCPTDEEIAQENATEAYCGPYDPSRVQPDGSYLPKPGC